MNAVSSNKLKAYKSGVVWEMVLSNVYTGGVGWGMVLSNVYTGGVGSVTFVLVFT